jgi:hypothetical protein
MPDDPFRQSRHLLIGIAVACAIGAVVAAWNWLQIDTQENLTPADRWEYRLRAGVGVLIMLAAFLAFGGLYPTQRLKDGLAALEPLVGKTKDQVTAVLGKPREVEYADEGRVTRARWGSPPFFRFALSFRDDVCTGLVHKTDGD